MATIGRITTNEVIVNSDIQANQLAVTSDVQFSGPVVCSDIVYLDGGANSDLVSGLNADLFDGAQLDTDVTMAADTDVAVPTQHAVKYYVDSEIAALDTAVVHDTGNETIAGVKTFSSVPLLPDNTIETNDIQNSAVTAAKIGTGAVLTVKLATIAASHDSVNADAYHTFTTKKLIFWVSPDGAHFKPGLYEGGAWHEAGVAMASGILMGEANLLRLHNTHGDPHTFYFAYIA